MINNRINQGMNNRRIEVTNAQGVILELDRQRQEQVNIIEQATNNDAIDRAILGNLNVTASLQEQNRILYLTQQELLVIPFLIEQDAGMPFDITTSKILDDMTLPQLRYYLAGYGLQTEGNKMELRERLGAFIGIPRNSVLLLYGRRTAAGDGQRTR
jgi:hypothetical protein